MQETHESCSNLPHRIVMIRFHIFVNKNCFYKVYPARDEIGSRILVTNVTFTQNGGGRHSKQGRHK